MCDACCAGAGGDLGTDPDDCHRHWTDWRWDLPSRPEQRVSSRAPLGNTAVSSWHGVLHLVFGSVAFLSLSLACFVFARRYSGRSERGLQIASIVAGIACLIGIMSGGAPGGTWPSLSAGSSPCSASPWQLRDCSPKNEARDGVPRARAHRCRHQGRSRQPETGGARVCRVALGSFLSGRGLRRRGVATRRRRRRRRQRPGARYSIVFLAAASISSGVRRTRTAADGPTRRTDRKAHRRHGSRCRAYRRPQSRRHLRKRSRTTLRCRLRR